MTSCPSPFTPPDCDLRGLPFMPLDVIRLTDSDLFALSTGEEFKAAITLWCKAWLQVPAASLPNDDRILAHLSGVGSRWKRIKPVALRGFVLCSDGRLYHPVVADKANDAWERRGDWQEKQNNKTERQQRWRDKVKALSAELRELGVTPPVGASLASLESLLVDAKASQRASTRDATETALTGTGTGTLVPLSDDNGVPGLDLGDPASEVPDPEKVMFDGAVALLRHAGKSEAQARTMAGKWKRDFGPEAVITAIASAKREGAIEPISFIEACLRRRTKDERDLGSAQIEGMPC